MGVNGGFSSLLVPHSPDIACPTEKLHSASQQMSSQALQGVTKNLEIYNPARELQ